jgi:hypothetical protein
VSKDKAVTATPARTLHHCVTCACPADDLGEFTIYPPHERFYGRCDTCHEVRWQVEYHEFDDEAGRYRRTTHCGMLHPPAQPQQRRARRPLPR